MGSYTSSEKFPTAPEDELAKLWIGFYSLTAGLSEPDDQESIRSLAEAVSASSGVEVSMETVREQVCDIRDRLKAV